MPTHCRASLLRCLAQSGWNHAHWRRIVFSDESRFHLCPDDNRRHVCRRLGKRANPVFPIARHTGTSTRSYDLRAVLLQFPLQYSGLIFQQDNAKPRTPNVAMNCLKDYQTLFPWPAKSPDPSPSWDLMGRRLHLPGNVDDLACQLEQIWQKIPQETIRVLYHYVASCGSLHPG
ncbi:transposable element Tc1 transposase [Trichonephila clavipes]|uniref:Transposable element Tc1 transposase n=1 Tax=Trichonephila clavipes TaxID=2585209 RepID=A0A8X6W5M2_TRICX|nr:transposable element Tc1 transposase [Trichonephila clavipes]